VRLTWANRLANAPSRRSYRYPALLLLVTVVWGLTFPVLKIATGVLSGVEITTLRFCIAAVCMLPFVRGVSASAWRDGLLLGGLALFSMAAQAYGLQFIASNRSAFLTSLSVLMVPLLGLLLGARPRLLIFVAAALACFGIGLMSYEGEANLWADAATLLAALAYAVYTIGMSARAPRHSAVQLATAQVCCMAVMGLVWMALDSGGTRMANLPHVITIEVLCGLVFLGAIASAATFFLQALSQTHVSAEQAAIIYAMEPVFAALFAWFLLAEQMSSMAQLGAVIVVFAVLLSQRPEALAPTHEAPAGLAP
jgi:drug/metabolite transporter (DMT)-like permease